ncbi:hypothetical protein [Frankia sp. AiPa1]|uniref:hypothetical protein n=1 Tax=Frankia sp. AiPa1 TaxID=573492 RepID=UPI00202B17DD|nr:hypothetical protein [Frankia sp. AiPa1]MCL9761765.1 hypothetical protein [Frankia sp. AiPa1]
MTAGPSPAGPQGVALTETRPDITTDDAQPDAAPSDAVKAALSADEPGHVDEPRPVVPQPRKATESVRTRHRHLRKPLRTALVTAHVIVSVGWNGVAFAQLVLASTAAADPGLRPAAYELMHVIDRTLDIPLALLTLISGVVLSTKTRWGLLRHWWVAAKLTITVVAVISGGAVIRTLIVSASHASATSSTGYPAQAVALIVCGTLMNLLFITATILSIAKPWGRTPRGRREALAQTLATMGPERSAVAAPRTDPEGSAVATAG